MSIDNEPKEFGKIRINITQLNRIIRWIEDFVTEASEEDLKYFKDAYAFTKKMNSQTALLDLIKISPETILVLIDSGFLSESQERMASLMLVKDKKKIEESELHDPKELYHHIRALSINCKGPSAEMFINGRWYPVILHAEYYTSNHLGEESKFTLISTDLEIGDTTVPFSWFISDTFFRNEESEPVSFAMKQVLEKLGLRPLQTEMSEYFKKLIRMEELGKHYGKVVAVTNKVCTVERRTGWFGGGFEITPKVYGSPLAPRKSIIEPSLEASDYGNSGTGKAQKMAKIRLPFVRIFSLENKEYAYADVDDVEEYQWDATAYDRLVLPSDIREILDKALLCNVETIFGDILQGKHGGLVILANGSPGVGKTLTAEIFAEHTKRPLYVLQMGELGTNLESIEQSLRSVFERVIRWNAVLLFDEADVFMAKRGEDLERSSIVGVFLRLLDYYPGIMFLTTNRADVIDPAFKSRITIQFNYPDLTKETRAKIWTIITTSAKLKIDGDLNELYEIKINGRQIRNLVRFVKLMHPDGVTNVESIKKIHRFTPQ